MKILALLCLLSLPLLAQENVDTVGTFVPGTIRILENPYGYGGYAVEIVERVPIRRWIDSLKWVWADTLSWHTVDNGQGYRRGVTLEQAQAIAKSKHAEIKQQMAPRRVEVQRIPAPKGVVK